MTLLGRFFAAAATAPEPTGPTPQEDMDAYPPPETVAAPPYAPMVLCTVPTPLGYPDGSCHPSVADTGFEGWHGYRYWMSNTPYPPDTYEDPIVYRSNDRVTWEMVPGAAPLATHGRTTEFPAAYNSDTELLWDPEEQTMHAIWRWYGGSGTIILRARSSTDGETWGPVRDIDVGPVGLSPAAVRVTSNLWVIYMEGIRLTSTDPMGPYTGRTSTNLSKVRHGDVIYHAGMWWAIGTASAASGPAFASASRDGLTWSAPVEIPMTGGWTTGIYRPTILPSNVPGQMDVWAGVYNNLGQNQFETGYTRVPATVWTDLII